MTTPKTKSKQPAQEGAGPALAWSGDNPVEFSRAVAALEEAEIPVFKMSEHDQFTVPQISGPQYRIFVPKAQSSAANKAIREALGRNAEDNAKE